MTRIAISLNDLRKEVPHLTDRLQGAEADLHILRWGSATEPAFEIAFKGGTPDQLKVADQLLSQAYVRAAETLQ